VTRRRQPLWLNGAHLLALWAFALVQPLFDLLGRNADFFVARGSTSGDILFFALFVTLVPPLALFGIEALLGLVSGRARDAAHLVFVALLAALVVLGFAKKALDASSGLLIPLSLAAGAGLALWYWREATVRRFASVLAAAPVLFLFLFLVTSPVHKLVWSGEAHAEAANVDSRTPVIMVSFDEFALTSLLRADGTLDRERYPNFARFADRSVWFRNATTVADGTRWATPIVISGVLPKRDALPTSQDYPQNLFTALGGGYRLHVTEPVTRLCPRDLCADTGPRESESTGATESGSDTREQSFGERIRSLGSDVGIVSLHLVLPDDLRERLPSVSEQLGDFAKENSQAPAAIPRRAAPRGSPEAQRRARREAGRRLTELIPAAKEAEQSAPAFPRFVASIRPWSGTGKPPLYFLHVLLPHHPWRLLPSGRIYGASVPAIPGLRDNVWNGDRVAVEQGWQRHMLQVGYVDRVLGDLMAKLRATGLWDRSLVVLTADHGVAFGTNSPRRRITRDDVGGIGAVPFFVKLPRAGEARVVERHVETIDILPTIADVLDFRLPRRVDGQSALARRFRTYHGVRIWSTTSTREFKRLNVPWKAFLRRRSEVMGRQAGLFGSGDQDPQLLWAVGPNREQVGQALAAGAAEAAPVAGSVRFDRPDELTAWTPDAGWSPSHVSGEVDGLPAGRDLALIVGGRVAAVGRTYDFLGHTRFSFMAREGFFGAGANDVRVFAVQRAGSGLTLQRLNG
jgi:hypothetical protein